MNRRKYLFIILITIILVQYQLFDVQSKTDNKKPKKPKKPKEDKKPKNGKVVNGAIDEGYGEDQTALGQFVDSFENTNNITVMDDVVRNSTLNCIELNYTMGVKDYENYTDYTEVDIGADRIQVADYHIDHLAYRSETTYLYYDKGVGFFTDFLHEVKARSDFAQQFTNSAFWALTNNLEDITTIKEDGQTGIALDFYKDGSDVTRITLREFWGGNWYQDAWFSPAVNTWYYMTIEKIGTAISCKFTATQQELFLSTHYR